MSKETIKKTRKKIRKLYWGSGEGEGEGQGEGETKVKPKPEKTRKKTANSKTKTKAKATAKPAGVQMHGKQWENEIITVIVSPSKLEEALSQSHTAVHDIPKHLNKINPLVNISIKATGKNRIEFGDAKRTINNIEKQDSPVEAIIVSYSQSGNTKIPKNIMHINLTKGRQALLGSIENLHERINKLDQMVKSGNPEYKMEAKQLQQDMKRSGAALVVAPKIGNKEKGRSGRLQISLANIRKFAEENPDLVVSDNSCKVYGQECLSVIESGKRTFTPKVVATDNNILL